MSKTKRTIIDLTAVSKMVNSKWVIAQVELAKDIPLGTLEEVSLSDALRFGGKNPIVLIDVQFKDLNPVLVCDAGFDVELEDEGLTYKALSDVLKVSNVALKKTLDSKGAKIEFSGEIDEYIHALELNRYIGGMVTIRVAFTDDDNNVISVFNIQRGMMDKPQIKKTRKNIKVEIQLSSIFRTIERVSGSLPVDTMHQLNSSGDTIFQYVPEARI